MAKNLKLTIKNTQIAEAINLGSLKGKLAKKKTSAETPDKEHLSEAKEPVKILKENPEGSVKEEAPTRMRARSKSAFSEGFPVDHKPRHEEQDLLKSDESIQATEEISKESGDFDTKPVRTSEELRRELFGSDIEIGKAPKNELGDDIKAEAQKKAAVEESLAIQRIDQTLKDREVKQEAPKQQDRFFSNKLGPTGRHVNDLYQPKPKVVAPQPTPVEKPKEKDQASTEEDEKNKAKQKLKVKGKVGEAEVDEAGLAKKGAAPAKFKEFRDIKPPKKQDNSRQFDVRDRQGLRDTEDDQRWRKKRPNKQQRVIEDITIRPTTLKIRIPISIKDLASEMKLKASQLVAKLFLQGVVVTLNDLLEDETIIQLLGHDFGCDITIDYSEQERVRITHQTIQEEIQGADESLLKMRAPVVAFMGHVDHGKTSLIDAIRNSNRAAGEAGAITQHIGAFLCTTPVGNIAILDTPGHEAFSAMRARGADVTDIVVLVVAGDEGLRQQTLEAIQHAKAANVIIVVAINKSDKPNFNADNVYRQLADNELLPEAWGGQIITVNCSAVTGEGIPRLLEMLALQAEVLELKANPNTRARGRVLESKMHKGMGSVATVLVQNGTLRLGDSLVVDHFWGRIKTMQDEFGKHLQEAGPSTPVAITGLSGLPEAGQEFVVVKNEREAREIAAIRMQGTRQTSQIKKKISMENLFQQATENSSKKILNIVLRADVQGSLEALKVALQKVESKKADLNIIFSGVGEVSESDIQLAMASKAIVVGFHTQIESHAEALIKQSGVQVRMHDIIYHAIDDVKLLLAGLLDRIAEETEKGKATVQATFKSSHYGIIAGCIVSEGAIHRNNQVRVLRGGEVVAKTSISSLKRVKDDVREVAKGLECGIVLNNFTDYKEGDVLEAYEVTYVTQEL